MWTNGHLSFLNTFFTLLLCKKMEPCCDCSNHILIIPKCDFLPVTGSSSPVYAALAQVRQDLRGGGGGGAPRVRLRVQGQAQALQQQAGELSDWAMHLIDD